MKKQLRYAVTMCTLLFSSANHGFCPVSTCNITSCNPCDQPCHTLKHYPIRPQGRSKDRQLVATTRYTHNDDEQLIKFTATATTEYMRSYKPDEILHYLFGPDVKASWSAPGGTCCSAPSSCMRTIHIQGSEITNRDPCAWFADYFYLPRDFDATVSFSPRITNILVDFDFYLHLNGCMKGLYARAYGPVVNAQWDLNMCETVSLNADSKTTGGYPLGYFATVPIPKNKLVQSFTTYAAGGVPSDDYQAGQVIPYPPNIDYAQPEDAAHHITFHPLNAARMCPFVCRKTGFADIRFELGWNMLTCDEYHFGLDIQCAIPSGKRTNPFILFDPIIGNGRHWELGGGLTAHYVFWKNEEESCHIAGHFDANLTHIFKAREPRTFDLRGKPNSCYMLASLYRANDGTPPFEQLYVSGTDQATCGDTPSHLFALEYAPVANLTTLNVRVSNDLHADLVAMLSLYTEHVSFDIGYNFWARTTEVIDFTDPFNECTRRMGVICNPGQQGSRWALKGDARMFGYVSHYDTELPPQPVRSNPPVAFDHGSPQALSATESKADMYGGTNNVSLDFSSNDLNNTIDNTAPANVCKIEDEIPNVYVLNNEPDSEAGIIQTSYEPEFLSYDLLDIVTPRQMSHKFFTNLALICDRESWHPFLSVGAFAEVGRNKDCRTCPPCPYNLVSRIECALTQWAVFFKIGVAFE